MRCIIFSLFLFTRKKVKWLTCTHFKWDFLSYSYDPSSALSRKREDGCHKKKYCTRILLGFSLFFCPEEAKMARHFRLSRRASSRPKWHLPQCYDYWFYWILPNVMLIFPLLVFPYFSSTPVILSIQPEHSQKQNGQNENWIFFLLLEFCMKSYFSHDLSG